jgi:TolB protein
MSPKLGAPRRAILLFSSFLAAAALVPSVAVGAGPAPETAAETFPASTTPSGEFAEAGVEESGSLSISADGRYVGFISASPDLNAVGTTTLEAYVKDLESGAVELASRADGATGAPADERVEAGLLATGGRYLAFSTAAEGIVAGVPTPPTTHVYRRDLRTGATTIVDRADGPGGEIVPSTASLLAISADGELVAFTDRAQGLGEGSVAQPEGEETIYVRDLATGTTTEVAAEGAEEAAFSADDRYLLFTSEASTLPEASGIYEVYRRDLQTGATVLVSRSNPTVAAPEGEPSGGEAYEATFVGDSDCEVAFMGRGPNELVSGLTAAPYGVYERDFCASPPTTTLLSVDGAGEPFESAVGPSATTDGRVAFIAAESSFESAELYVDSPGGGSPTLLSRASGAEGEAADHGVATHNTGKIAAGGCRAVFTTDSLNLVGETEAALPGPWQVFARQLDACRPAPEVGGGTPPATTAPAPAPPAAAPGPAPNAAASMVRIAGISRHGLRLAFDGLGTARVRVQQQAPGGGWKLFDDHLARAVAAGVVHLPLSLPGGGRPVRLKVRLQGDPDNPTLTRRLGSS